MSKTRWGLEMPEEQIELDVGARDLAQIVKTFIDRADTVESLNSYYTMNKEAIGSIKDLDVNAYNDLIDAFKKHKEKIMGRVGHPT